MATADPVLTLADLESWSFPGTALAVVGHPIKHSISPAMHNAALAELARTDKRFATWKYFRFDVPPEDLPRALKLFYEKKFFGLNLTVPHKVIALDHLSGVFATAEAGGAANTLFRVDEGEALKSGWWGENTDRGGLIEGIRESLGLEVENADIILLGAGGAARAAAVECRTRRHCRSLWIANRTHSNRDSLLAFLKSRPGKCSLHGFDPQDPPTELPAGAIVINATSAGLRETDEQLIDLTHLPRPAGVYDMIYNPQQTKLLAQAKHLGIPNANGLSMLIYQGVLALEIWTKASPQLPANAIAAMRTAANAALKA